MPGPEITSKLTDVAYVRIDGVKGCFFDKRKQGDLDREDQSADLTQLQLIGTPGDANPHWNVTHWVQDLPAPDSIVVTASVVYTRKGVLTRPQIRYLWNRDAQSLNPKVNDYPFLDLPDTHISGESASIALPAVPAFPLNGRGFLSLLFVDGNPNFNPSPNVQTLDQLVIVINAFDYLKFAQERETNLKHFKV